MKVNWQRRWMVRLIYLIMFLLRPNLHSVGLLALWKFLLQFPVKYRLRQKKLLGPHLSAGFPGTVPFCKSSRGYYITFIKSLDKCLGLQFLKQNFCFFPGYTLKLVDKILN